MAELYKQLAEHLDKLPAGFPSTENGVELRILKRLFTEEEARVAMLMTMIPETADQVAARTGEDLDTLAPMIDAMSRKGLLLRMSKGGENKYLAAQFVIGIWEYHLNDLDEDLIRDVNEYLPQLMEKLWVKQDTKQLRVVPISKSVSAEMRTMPYEVAEEIIKSQSKIVVAPCICRREHEMVGKGCGKPMEVCLSFGGGAFYYEENGLGRSIDQAEALDILKQGLDAGLVLQPGNAQKPTNICMCCGCCCQVLKNLRNLESPAKVVHTNYYAKIDEEACVACEDCIERCQMDAISMIDDAAVVNVDRCIGCGLCVPECPSDAVALVMKNEDELYVPPGNTVETYITMAQERGLL